MIRVSVAGASGRLGRVACAALQHADGIVYAGGFARAPDSTRGVVTDLGELFATQKPDVLLDVTTHPSTVAISMQAIDRGIRPAIGATGWTEDERDALRRAAEAKGLGAMLVPNFSIGALLMMRFAEEASRYFPTAEIVEMHHDTKKDAPSGTSRLTAERIAAVSAHRDVPIHSVRLRGLVAHQEVLFGGEGELLTIRHDSLSRESFVPGIIAAVRQVMDVRGLQVGLELPRDEVAGG